jgi:type I restriction enzyme R subunit
VFESAARAETAVHADPRTACFYARRALELAVCWAYKHDASLKLPYQDNLSALIHEPSFKQTAGEAVFSKARVINTLGNRAVHGHRAILLDDAMVAVRELFHVTYWLARTYGRAARPAPGVAFDASALPKAAQVRGQTAEQLQQLEAGLRERDEKLAALLADKTTLDEELKRLRAEVAAAKLAAAAQPDTHDYSEAETRDYFIDLLLKEAGWPLVQPPDHRASSKSAACRTRKTRASSTTCSGATTASRSGWSKPSAPGAMRASASSRPSSTPTAWSASSASAR